MTAGFFSKSARGGIAASLLVLLAGASRADVTLPAILSDHMVLQRTAQAHIWGKADPGEKIAVTFNKITAQSVAEADGNWQATLDLSKSEQGPFDLLVEGKNKITVADVVVGDVWICSGQSNMEFVLGAAASFVEEAHKPVNPLLRQFKVAGNASPKLEEGVTGTWVIAGPTTVSQFTAVGYYFGNQIQKTMNIPVGIINATWGGTQVEGWTSAEGFAKQMDQIEAHDKKLATAAAYPQQKTDFLTAYHGWEQQYGREDKTFDPTSFTDSTKAGTDWKSVSLPGNLSAAGLPDAGAVWMKKTITVPASSAGKAARVNLGTPQCFETVFWNGQKVGEMTLDTFPGVGAQHSYNIPPELVKEGDNTLDVRLFCPSNNMGITGAITVFVFPPVGQVSLAGDWKGKAEFKLPALTPEALKAMPAFIQSPTPLQYLPSYLYNGMIHPLLPLAIKGVTWYQGEGNANRAYQYRSQFPQMIADWRSHWGTDFPFYFCQLANYMERKPSPSESAWAELREAQSMALSVPGTGQAVLIDLGEANNIHYRNKKDAGNRLGLIALARTYGQAVPYSGPVFDSMKVEGNQARISYKFTDQGLVVHPPDSTLQGFAICGDNHEWVWADAKINGNTVLVSSPSVAQPVAVRYAWADNPACNLYNGAGLPAAPFRTDTFTGVTEPSKN